MTFKSPASNATHNPIFDNGNASSPAEDWELDMTLLPQDHLEISKHQSEYEHSRAYNMIWNKKALDQLDLLSSVNNLFPTMWVMLNLLQALCTDIHPLPAKCQLNLLHLKATLYLKLQPCLLIRALHLDYHSRQHLTVDPIRTEFIHLTWGIFIFTCNILNKNIEIWLVKMWKYRPPNLACQIQKF